MSIDADCPIIIRLAKVEDAMSITLLYQQVYQGHYPNPLMRDTAILSAFLTDTANVWVVAELRASGAIIGSVVFEADAPHRLSRSFGAAVMPEFRGHAILEKSMQYGQEHLIGSGNKADVIYGMTRTSSQAPQVITEKLGYKKLGIFPNIRRTDNFETHCLTALYAPDTLHKRFNQFKIHPSIARLFEIVRVECGMPPQPIATKEDFILDDFNQTIDLELITAEKYVLHRFRTQEKLNMLQANFYPFHLPNMVISSPCQTVEIFIYTSSSDTYCTIMGVKKPREYNFTWILDRCTALLRKIGVRYLEVMIRPDKTKIVERVLHARFIPCAYFPAFQLNNGLRYDFVIFSRTFEIPDFHNIHLTGKNMTYLEEYLLNLKQYFLEPHLNTKP